MKPYPFEDFIICDWETFTPEGGVKIPTSEAIKNFTEYLEPNELIIYESLTTIEQLQLQMSVNIFEVFKERYLK